MYLNLFVPPPGVLKSSDLTQQVPSPPIPGVMTSPSIVLFQLPDGIRDSPVQPQIVVIVTLLCIKLRLSNRKWQCDAAEGLGWVFTQCSRLVGTDYGVRLKGFHGWLNSSD